MKNTKIDKIAQNLVKAFVHNKIIAPIPLKFTKDIVVAEKVRRICESKVKLPIIGFKAGGTSIPLLKKWRIKKPFYAAVYEKNLLQTGKKVKINPYVLGAELEVGYYIKKKFFETKERITSTNIHKYISHDLPAIEIVGYRQRKKGIKSLGDLCSDFGANIKFVVGPKKKIQNNNVKNLKTKIFNMKSNQSVTGNTNTVYIHPMNSLLFVLTKLQKDKIKLKNNFYVFTGSSVGIVPILSKSTYFGKIEKIGNVKVKIS